MKTVSLSESVAVDTALFVLIELLLLKPGQRQMMSYLEKDKCFETLFFQRSYFTSKPTQHCQGPLIIKYMKIHIFDTLNQKALFKVRAVINQEGTRQMKMEKQISSMHFRSKDKLFPLFQSKLHHIILGEVHAHFIESQTTTHSNFFISFFAQFLQFYGHVVYSVGKSINGGSIQISALLIALATNHIKWEVWRGLPDMFSLDIRSFMRKVQHKF